MKFPINLSKTGAVKIRSELETVLRPEHVAILDTTLRAWMSDVMNSEAADRVPGSSCPPAFEVRGFDTVNGRPYLIELADEDFEWSE